MNRWNLALAGVLAWGWLAAPFAFAQFQGPIGGYTPPYTAPPAFSPFLNLNRPGTNPAINYYGLVQPQLQTRQQLSNLQYQQNALASGLGGGTPLVTNQALPQSTTGHPVRYFDYSRYFPLGGLPGTFGTANGVAPGAGGLPGYAQPARTGLGNTITPGVGLFVR
jgi:hypothetical protein